MRRCATDAEGAHVKLTRPLPALVAFAIALVFVGAQAQTDAEGSRDHPMLQRYPDSHIGEYRKNFDAVEFRVREGGKERRQRVEGDTTVITYRHNNAERQPSALQVIRNYQNAVKAIGGQVLYERLPRDSDSGETTLKVAAGGKEVWVRVAPDIFGAPTQAYTLTVVEVAGMAQVVTANALLDEINKKGFVALYINFDTGRHELKPDGQQVVREIVAMMRSAPSLKLGIEGHTDNVGSAADNKALSERRAQSVRNAIVQAGIDPGRLTAAGFGQERPVADNRTEDGRAKNRRVELVKK
jgi:outer membrane protein OmpA-like peptidoglycan-associated protein